MIPVILGAGALAAAGALLLIKKKAPAILPGAVPGPVTSGEAALPPLDPNLTDRERMAVAMALRYEGDANMLAGFSKTMMPDLPLSAAALDAKARRLGYTGGVAG